MKAIYLLAFQNIMFPHTITYTHNRNAYIKISDKGSVLFSIPHRLKHNQPFLHQLHQKAETLRKRHQSRTKIEQHNAEGIFILGEWIPRNEFLGEGKAIPSQATLEKQLKTILYEYAHERLDIFSQQLHTPYRSLSIRKAKSRRGSCSHDQRIMLNLSLVYLASTYVQYVIAHEAAHLVEKNHSPAFWKLVESLFPNYQTVRKNLKKLTIL
ncbi:MAG: M48 family metallopeptidase [Candidatus Peribacteria bacterium]|jgi:predicted metal-dependent hydrolase|nr:M48 family metallopeptidase [Candidatus Peribacteria bacterium]